jgi:hypothetical protein
MHTDAIRRTALVPAILLVISGFLMVAPASAQASTSCRAVDDVCKDTRANFTDAVATIATLSDAGYPGQKYWSISKGLFGDTICSGRMGFNDTRTCDLGGYTGQLTARFVKGQGTLVVVSLRSQD